MRRQISVSTFGIALAIMTLFRLIQVPSWSESQAFEIGVHWKIVAAMTAIDQVRIIDPRTRHETRILWLSKARTYMRRNAILTKAMVAI